MDTQVKQEDRSPDHDFNGLIVQTLFGYLGAWAPAGSIERMLQLAGETRTVAELGDAANGARTRSTGDCSRAQGGAGRPRHFVAGRAACL